MLRNYQETAKNFERSGYKLMGKGAKWAGIGIASVIVLSLLSLIPSVGAIFGLTNIVVSFAIMAPVLVMGAGLLLAGIGEYGIFFVEALRNGSARGNGYLASSHGPFYYWGHGIIGFFLVAMMSVLGVMVLTENAPLVLDLLAIGVLIPGVVLTVLSTLFVLIGLPLAAISSKSPGLLGILKNDISEVRDGLSSLKGEKREVGRY